MVFSKEEVQCMIGPSPMKPIIYTEKCVQEFINFVLLINDDWSPYSPAAEYLELPLLRIHVLYKS
jgi:hypothetical protein